MNAVLAIARPTNADLQPIRLMPERRMSEANQSDATAEPAGGPEAWQLDVSVFDVAKHNGCVTIHNPLTGQHRTFRIETELNEESPLKGRRIVSLLVGPDNEADYVGFAFVEGGFVKVWKRFRATGGGKSDHERFANLLMFPRMFAEKRGLRYVIEGRCRKCNRKLTRVDSIATGLGPMCAKKA